MDGSDDRELIGGRFGSIQEIVCKTLSLTLEEVTAASSFLQLGGDSLTAIEVVARCRSVGLIVRIADLMKCRTLKKVASLTLINDENLGGGSPEPWSLLPEEEWVDIAGQVRKQCGLDPEEIVQDVYPTTALQEGLMALAVKQPGSYMSSSTMILSADTDANRFKAVWEHTLKVCELLRTRIVLCGRQTLQAVIQAEAKWECASTVAAYTRHVHELQMTYGSALCKYWLLHNGEHTTFGLAIHHAVFDGWSLRLIFRVVAQLYSGREVLQVQLTPYASFIKHVTSLDKAKARDYWLKQLSGASRPNFPLVQHTEPRADGPASRCLMRTISFRFCPNASVAVTRASLLRAAWAITLAWHSESTEETVFGATVTGRQAPVDGIERMVGPAICTVPVRVKLCRTQLVTHFLEDIQAQAVEMIPFEQTGLQNIAQLSKDAREACAFATIMVVQPNEGQTDEALPLVVPQVMDADWSTFFNYPLVMQCWLAENEFTLQLIHDVSVVKPGQADSLAQRYDYVVQQLLSALNKRPRMTLEDVDILTSEDMEEQWAPNTHLPSAVDRCVHDLFSDRAKDQPEAQAICAWDGEMTYSELDDASTRLAAHLVQLGVQPEDIVPLCFEKSMWAVVAMLAVLKTGGAFAPLDPAHPQSRHEEILRQTGSKLLLTSTLQSSLWEGSPRTVVTVSEASIQNLSNSTQTLSLPIHPGNAAYIMFTSGSTGVPKGVVLEHRAVATGCLGHGKAFGLTSQTRFLQFAAFTFDISITETVATLLYGGSLCIPSEDDRRNNLAKAINVMQANSAYLTPTVTWLLDPASVPSLKKLIFGGEEVRRADCERWRGKTEIINAYGPTECTVLCTAFFGLDGFISRLIGKPIACVGWVVDPNNHNKLAPLGSVGELLIEGPILARGYLNDTQKTTAAFINDPAWLLKGSVGCPGRHGRLYKTGDLVHYSSDGNLIYVGRKDSQVKVRGQRVELGEIEHHVRAHMPEAQQVAVEVITPAGEKKSAMLAAFLQLDDKQRNALQAAPGNVKNDSSTVQTVVLGGVDKKLAETLPSHMIPDIYFALPQLPMTVSGKTDRKRLREIGASFSAQQLAELQTSSRGPKRQPSTEAERTMQQLWAHVLNIKPDTIGMDDSFFRLGGDSITAMQLSASARLHQIHLSTRDIFRQKTVAELARHAMSSRPLYSQLAGAAQDPVNTLFGLTPIQELYLQLEPTGKASFDQTVFLELRTQVSLQSLRAAFKTLIQRHSMLRARFSRAADKGRWQQYISDTTVSDAAFTVQHVRPRDNADITQAICQSRGCLDIESGPVTAAVLFDGSHSQSLFIAVHHLVIDLVSWRVVLEELEDLLLGKTLSPASSMPYQAWQALQNQHAATDTEHNNAMQDKLDLDRGQLSYWGVEPSDVSHVPAASEHFVLDSETTSALLGTSNDALQTRPLELMVAALIHSFAAVFPDRSPPPVFNETHGREPWDDSIDLSRTVGWFTSLFPVQAPAEARGSLLNVVRATKDCMRGFKDSGRSYFASRFVSEDASHDFASAFPVEMMFNYQGAYQQLERDESLFKSMPLPDGCEPASAAGAAGFSLFTVTVVMANGCAHVSFTQSGIAKHQARVQDWIQQYKATLVALPNLLCFGSFERPPSDPSPPSHSNSALDRFSPPPHPANTTMAYSLLPPGFKEAIFSDSDPVVPGLQLSNVVDILPATYIQQNYVTQGVEMPPLAFNYLHIELGPHLDSDLLKDSCRKLVDHFPILRTRFFHRQGRWWQIVLRDINFTFSNLEVDGSLSKESHAFTLRDSERIDPLELPTSFAILRNRSQGNRLIIRLSHAQYDGFCLPSILSALASIYEQKPLRPVFNFSTYLAHAQNQKTEAIQHWRELLQGSRFSRATAKLQPAVPDQTFPSGVFVRRSICAPVLPGHLTMASVVSSAWAVLLSRITGTDDVVYGQIVAGRNADIPGITEIVGPCINIVPVRALTPPDKTVEELALDVQEQYVSLGQSDSMGWDEIVQQCTDWTPNLAPDSVFLHQNIELEPEICIAGATGKSWWFNHPLQVAHHILISSQSQDNKLEIAIAGNSHIMKAGTAESLLDMLVETVTTLSTGLQAPLASCKSSLPAFD